MRPDDTARGTRDGITIRRPTVHDGPRIHRLVREGGGLDDNSRYLYLLMAGDFAATCRVADGPDGADGPLLGFVMGYRPPERPDAAFVWQVAVAPAGRGKGLGSKLLDAFIAGAEGARFLEATVTPSNTASRRLFERFARRREVPCVIEPGFAADLFRGAGPETHTHEREDLFRIGPLRS